MKIIAIIGCEGTHVAPAGMEALCSAEVLFGPRALLDLPEVPTDKEKRPLNLNSIAAARELMALAREKRIAILSAGDPLFHGVGSSLLREIPAKHLSFYPCATAFQLLFARLGVPWHHLRTFRISAGEPLPFRAIFRSGLAAIYGDAGRGAKALAAGLVAAFPTAAKRRAAVGIRLGLPNEQIVTGTLAQIAANEEAAAPLSLLALLPDAEADIPALPLGLPDRNYVHFKNMITHQEVRAVVLSKLRLQRGVMWDLGAGSGSVALEAAGLCPDLQVHAVEKNPERYRQLCENMAKEGLGNLTAYEGGAEEVLERLPAPDRIFIGGGDGDLLCRSFERLLPGGRMVATGVMVESISLLTSILPAYRKELVSVNISRAKEIATGGSMFWAENSIMIAVFRKPAAAKHSPPGGCGTPADREKPPENPLQS